MRRTASTLSAEIPFFLDTTNNSFHNNNNNNNSNSNNSRGGTRSAPTTPTQTTSTTSLFPTPTTTTTTTPITPITPTTPNHLNNFQFQNNSNNTNSTTSSSTLWSELRINEFEFLFEAILDEPEAYDLFKHYCKTVLFTDESVSFMDEVGKLKVLRHWTNKHEQCASIIEQYVRNGAVNELNLSAGVRCDILRRWDRWNGGNGGNGNSELENVSTDDDYAINSNTSSSHSNSGSEDVVSAAHTMMMMRRKNSDVAQRESSVLSTLFDDAVVQVITEMKADIFPQFKRSTMFKEFVRRCQVSNVSLLQRIAVIQNNSLPTNERTVFNIFPYDPNQQYCTMLMISRMDVCALEALALDQPYKWKLLLPEEALNSVNSGHETFVSTYRYELFDSRIKRCLVDDETMNKPSSSSRARSSSKDNQRSFIGASSNSTSNNSSNSNSNSSNTNSESEESSTGPITPRTSDEENTTNTTTNTTTTATTDQAASLGRTVYRATGTLPYSIEAVLHTLLEPSLASHYDNRNIKLEVVQTVNITDMPNHYPSSVLLETVPLPWPIATRDFVTSNSIVQSRNEEGKDRYMIIKRSIESNKHPVRKGVRRAHVFSGWILEKLNESITRYTFVEWSNIKLNDLTTKLFSNKGDKKRFKGLHHGLLKALKTNETSRFPRPKNSNGLLETLTTAEL